MRSMKTKKKTNRMKKNSRTKWTTKTTEMLLNNKGEDRPMKNTQATTARKVSIAYKLTAIFNSLVLRVQYSRIPSNCLQTWLVVACVPKARKLRHRISFSNSIVKTSSKIKTYGKTSSRCSNRMMPMLTRCR